MKKFLLITLFFLGVGLRFYYFWYPIGRSSELTVDEAVYGVQALNILNGDRPVFYPAQDYTGSFSAYLSALVLAVFGVSAGALKIVPFLFSVGTLFLIYILALKILGPKVAIGSLLIAALGTPFWNNWSSRAGTGYVEATFLGGLVLLLTLKIIEDKGRYGLNFWLWGFLAGLGFWVQPTIVYFVLPSLVFLFLNLTYSDFLKKILSYSLIGFLLGALPVFYYNLFVRTSATAAALFKVPWGVRGALFKLITEGFPVILGGRTANSLVDFNSFVSPLIYLIFLLALVFFLVRTLKFGSLGQWFFKAETLLLFNFVTTLMVFLVSTPFNQLSIEPRYVFGLYLTLPIFLGSFLAFLLERSKVTFLLVTLIYLLNSVLGLRLAGPLTFVDGYSFTPLVDYLRSEGISYAITTAAVGHRLTFFSNEAVKAQVRGGGITEARFENLNREVTKARDIEPRLVAYVTLGNELVKQSFTDEAKGIVGEDFSIKTIANSFWVLLPRK